MPNVIHHHSGGGGSVLTNNDLYYSYEHRNQQANADDSGNNVVFKTWFIGRLNVILALPDTGKYPKNDSNAMQYFGEFPPHIVQMNPLRSGCATSDLVAYLLLAMFILRAMCL